MPLQFVSLWHAKNKLCQILQKLFSSLYLLFHGCDQVFSCLMRSHTIQQVVHIERDFENEVLYLITSGWIFNEGSDKFIVIKHQRKIEFLQF